MRKKHNMNIKSIVILVASTCLLASPVLGKNDKNKNTHESLPPGLEKKHSQGKPLPPGWQKKLSKGDILASAVYVRGRIVVPLGKDGSLSISVDGTIIKLFEETRIIIDIAR